MVTCHVHSNSNWGIRTFMTMFSVTADTSLKHFSHIYDSGNLYQNFDAGMPAWRDGGMLYAGRLRIGGVADTTLQCALWSGDFSYGFHFKQCGGYDEPTCPP